MAPRAEVKMNQVRYYLDYAQRTLAYRKAISELVWQLSNLGIDDDVIEEMVEEWAFDMIAAVADELRYA
jgi:hypothetical protein